MTVTAPASPPAWTTPALPAFPRPSLDKQGSPDKGPVLAGEQEVSDLPALCSVLSPLHPGKREVLTTQFVFPGAYLCFSKPVALLLTSPWEKQPKF